MDAGDVPPSGEGMDADEELGPRQKVWARWMVHRVQRGCESLGMPWLHRRALYVHQRRQ